MLRVASSGGAARSGAGGWGLFLVVVRSGRAAGSGSAAGVGAGWSCRGHDLTAADLSCRSRRGADRAEPDGTAARPFVDLQRSIYDLEAGDALLLHEGDYSGEFNIEVHGTGSAPVVIAAAPGEHPVLYSADWQVFRLSGAQHVEIRGLELVGDPDAFPDGNGIGLYEQSRHIRVIDNVIHDFGGGGVSINQSGPVHVEGNTIYRVAATSRFRDSGISLYQLIGEPSGGWENIVRGNTVWGAENTVPDEEGNITDGNCIIVDDGRHTQRGSQEPVYEGWTLVENNLCVGNGGRGVHVYLSDRVLVRNNTLVGNGLTGDLYGRPAELSANRAASIEFRDNAVIVTDGVAAVGVERSDSVVFQNNIVQGRVDFATAATGGEGLIVVDDLGLVAPDPLDPTSGDYRPQPGSPLVDAATGGPDLDLAGIERGSTPDVGAFEAG